MAAPALRLPAVDYPSDGDRLIAEGSLTPNWIRAGAYYLRSWGEVALHTFVLTRVSGVEPFEGLKGSDWRWMLLSLQQVFGGLGLVFAALAARRVAKAE